MRPLGARHQISNLLRINRHTHHRRLFQGLEAIQLMDDFRIAIIIVILPKIIEKSRVKRCQNECPTTLLLASSIHFDARVL